MGKFLILIAALAGLVYWGKDFILDRDVVITPTVTIKSSPAATRAYTPTSTIPSMNSGQVLLSVPFTAQAPLGNWADLRQQDGCEEASVLMAMRWVKGQANLTAKEAEREILKIAAFEEENYGNYHDTSAQDTVKWIFNGYFDYDSVRAETDITVADIIAELRQGNLIIVPANGQKLGNPHYTAPGPERHMLVIKGYDPAADQFITNDPGTRLGNSYRYSTQRLFDAIYNYKTGYHVPVTTIEKAMIVIRSN